MIMCVVLSNPTVRSRGKMMILNMPFHLILHSLRLNVCVCYLILMLSGLNNNLV